MNSENVKRRNFGRKAITASVAFFIGVASGVFLLINAAPVVLDANAASQEMTAIAGNSPTRSLPERDAYFPGTEELKPDEMRVIACGTGMPNARPRQAAACFLVELGNGDKFIFDIGLGSAERIAAMQIPYDYLDKVFLGHLHADHIGDLDALWIGGVISNRQVPLRVFGPSGDEEKLGTKYMTERMAEMYAWDWASRQGNVNTKGFQMDVTEFDYAAVNEAIYQENGVTIRTIPAIHAVDGSVSFILEWNDLKFAFSSDTYPNRWWIEHTKDADLSIHECFAPPSIMVTKQKFAVGDALNVATQVHTSPAMFGKVMAQTKPRLAVGYHVFNDFDTKPQIMQEIRQTYDGPVDLAIDYMVWNVTKDEIRTRMAVVDEAIWPQPSIYPPQAADPTQRIGFSKEMASGRMVFDEVIEFYYNQANEMFGTDFEPPK
jgi:ribonuclease Z